MSRPNKKFKYSITNIWKRVKAKLKTTHENFKKPQAHYNGNNTYQEFTHWSLDVLEYGVVLEIIHTAFTGWHGWSTLLWILAFGLLWWFILDFIREIKYKLTE